MATIDVLDAVGATQTIAKVAATGQAAMADSLPVAIASDQTLPLPTGAATETTLDDIKTAVEALAAGDPPTETTLATLATEATLAAQSAKLPASLGIKTAANSLSVAPASDAVLPNVAAASNATSSAYEASRVVKGSAGTLYGLAGYNSKASGQFIQLHDATSLPSDTAVPAVVVYVQPLSSFSIDFGLRGRAFAIGIVAACSSTGPALTVGSADCWFDAQYA